MKRIWVSYSHDIDCEELMSEFIRLVNELSDGKVEVDSDKEFEISNFPKEIDDKISKANHHVLLVTERFLGRDWCNEECIKIYPHNKTPTILTNITNFDILEAVNKGSNLNIFNNSDYKIITSDPQLKIKRKSNKELNLHVEDILKQIGVYNVDSPLRKYEPVITKGLFVPFIGPRCNYMIEEWEPAFPKLKQKINALEGSDGSENKVVTEYIRALIYERIPGAKEKLDAINACQLDRQDSTETEPRRGKLILAIARAAMNASHIIGHALNNNAPLLDTRTFGAEASGVQTKGEDTHKLLLNNISEAIEVAKTMIRKKDCTGANAHKQHACIGSYGIASGLDTMKNHLFGEDPQPLLLVQVEWLVELLWHTVRYDLSVIPTNEEFAFHFALCQAEQCLTRPSLGTVGMAAINAMANGGKQNIPSSYYQCIAGISRTGFKVGHSELYTQIAKMLLEASRTPENDDGMLSSSKQASNYYQNTVIPVAISLNMDTRLEDSLQDYDHSIISPVEIEKNSDNYLWMLRVEKNSKKEFYLLKNKDRYDGELKRVVKGGPLIVKLRGSYLHELPPGDKIPPFLYGNEGSSDEYVTSAEWDDNDESSDDFVPSAKSVANRVTVSSIDYAKELFSIDPGPPAFLEDMLNPEGLVMCFLGYPLDDQDAALSMQQAVWMSAKSGPKISIDCHRYDKLGKAFLNGLKVDPLDMDIARFVKELTKIIKNTTKGRRHE